MKRYQSDTLTGTAGLSLALDELVSISLTVYLHHYLAWKNGRIQLFENKGRDLCKIIMGGAYN